MMTYKTTKVRPSQFKSLTGLALPTFDTLHTHFSAVVDHDLRHYTIEGKERQRAKTVTKDNVFKSTQDMLLFIMIYLKTNPLQEVHAAQFEITQSQANVWIHRILKWLHTTLHKLKELPARSDQDLVKVLSSFSEVFIDGTERPIERSADHQVQKEHYSGKKNNIR